MNSPVYSKIILIVLGFTAALVVAPGCAPQRIAYNVEQLYQEHSFSSRELSGKSIVLLPLLTAQGPDTSGPLALGALSSWLITNRPDLRVVTVSKPFFERYAESTGVFSRLIGELYRGDVVEITQHAAAFKEFGHPYVVVIRLKNGLRIRGLDNRTKRRIELEGELWEVEGARVLWRGRVQGMSLEVEHSDEGFIARGVERLLMSLPQLPPSPHYEQNW
jgi:hypothetical protein